MKLLLDQCLPRSTVEHLAVVGITAEHVGTLGMASASDAAILDLAKQQQAVVVTLDSDFHQLLAASAAISPSVVRIRIDGLKGDQLAAILSQVIAVASEELMAGAVVSVTETAHSRAIAANYSGALTQGGGGVTLDPGQDDRGTELFLIELEAECDRMEIRAVLTLEMRPDRAFDSEVPKRTDGWHLK